MGSLGNIFLTRFARALLTIWLILTFTFFLLRLTGDPVQNMLPEDASQDEIDSFRQALGLDDHLLVQYLRYIEQMIQGNFGQSFRFRQPALDLIIERVPVTFQLAIVAFVLTTVFGLLLGTMTAYTRGSRTDRLASTLFGVLQSSPSFFMGIMLILLFSVVLGWLPTSGSSSFKHMILPSITLALGPIAGYARLTRSSLLEILGTDYIRTARAKGMSESRVWWSHAMRNAALPLVTSSGLHLAGLLTGAVLIETVFAIPGLGRLSVDAVSTRDYPLVQATVLFISILFVAINFLVDLSYQFLDPRISS